MKFLTSCGRRLAAVIEPKSRGLKHLNSNSALPFSTTTSVMSAGGDSGLNFELSDTQKEFQSLTRKFAREEMLPRAPEFDKSMDFPWELFKKAWSLGIVNSFVPPEFGGPGFGVTEGCIMKDEISYACTGMSTAFDIASVAAAPLLVGGSVEQKKKFLGRLMEEPCIASYAVTEPGAGSDVAGIKTTAVKKGADEWVINGQKMWITGAGVASWFFILARTDPSSGSSKGKAFTGFVVDAKTPGISPGRKEIMMGQRCSDTRGITFEDVVVKKENIVKGEGAGFGLAMATFDITRPPVGAAAVGLAQRALDEATRYAMKRKTFGTAIINHQAIAHLLADMAIDVELARLMTLRSAWEIDQGRKNTYFASIAKIFASNAAVNGASNAVQIFGGNGYNSEYPVEKLFRDSKIFQLYEGTSQIQKMIISREHIGRFKEGGL